MIDSKNKMKTVGEQSSTAGMPENVPILAYSEDVRSVSEIQQNAKPSGTTEDVYAIQVAQQEQPLSSNVKLSRHPQKQINSGSNGSLLAQRRLTGNSSQKLKVTTTEVMSSTPKSNLKTADKVFDPKPPASLTDTMQQQSQSQQSGSQPVQNVFQFNLRVNTNTMNGGGVVCEQQANDPGVVKSATNNAITTTPYRQQKAKSRDRRPLSSKHRSSAVYISQNVTAATTSIPTGNPYALHNRKGQRKRPVSANRKNLVHASATMKPALRGDQYKQAGNTFSFKKHALLNGNVNQPVLVGSAPSQKHRRLLYSQQHTGETTSMGAIHDFSTDANNPYHRSIKLASAFGVQIPSKTLHTTSKMQYQGQGVFSSPEKVQGKLKNKIPQMTLQSREDLYEQNMHTKIQINGLKNENRKINTKLQVLENQLVQKDKLFEDMYKAAFTQNGKVGVVANSHGQQSFHPSQGSIPHNSIITSINSVYKPQSFVAHSTSLSNSQQHHQAQQLINSYKRTMREMNRELDKRDIEIDQIKRSIKMTQINQLLVENETYRTECVRLRDCLEQAIVQQPSPKQRQMASPQSQYERSGTESFKRDTQNASNLANINEEKDQLQRHCEQLMQDKQAMMVRMAQQEQVNASQSLEMEQLKVDYKTIVENLQISNDVRQQAEGQVDDLQRQIQTMRPLAQQAATSESEVNRLRQSHLQLTSEIKDQNDAETLKVRGEIEAEHLLQMEQVRAECEAKHQGELSQLKSEIESFQAMKNTLEGRLKKTASQLNEAESALDKKEVQDDEYFQECNNSLEEKLHAEKQKYNQLERNMDHLVSQKAKTEKEFTVEKEHLLKIMKSQTDLATAQQKKEANRVTMMAQQVEELEAETEALEKKLADSEAKHIGKVQSLENDLSQQNQQIIDKDRDITQLKQRLDTASFQSPPVIPGQQRRSMKQALSSSRGGDGDSEFDRAPLSEYAGGAASGRELVAKLAIESEADDRSDLGFSSADDGEIEQPAPVPNHGNNNDATQEQKKNVGKICVNDKTVFGTDGFPLSPKELTADSVHVAEGLTRLRHACQVKFIRYDSIENFLFGAEYRPEGKLSIRRVKQAAIDSLKMNEAAALDFAQFIVEKSGGQAAPASAEVSIDRPFTHVDEDKVAQAMRVMLFITQKVYGQLVYYREEKEEKMRLIVGERLQNIQFKTKLLSSIKDSKLDEMTCEQLMKVFEQAGLAYNKETVQCCFIFLLKKADDYMKIKTKDLIEFVHASGAKALERTMTGANFPVETELVYSSDSEHGGDDYSESDDDVVDEVVQSNTAQPATPHAQQKLEIAAAQQQLASDEESSDDFGANESRSEYQDDQVEEEKVEIVQEKVEVIKEDKVQIEEQKVQIEEEKTQIVQAMIEAVEEDKGQIVQAKVEIVEDSVSEEDMPEEIESEDDLRTDITNHLVVMPQSTAGAIEDSMNDRDLESSIANHMLTDLPLPLITEAPKLEVSKQEKAAAVNDPELSKQYKTEPQTAKANVEVAIDSQASGPMSDATGSSDVGNKTKGKRRPNLNINIDPKSRLNGQKSISASESMNSFQIQVASLPPSTKNERDGMQLRPIKELAPAPFGIQVTHEQHSHYAHSSHHSSPDVTQNCMDPTEPIRDDIMKGTPDIPVSSMNTNTDHVTNFGQDLHHESVPSGTNGSNYQTRLVDYVPQNLEETKTFVVQDMVTVDSSLTVKERMSPSPTQKMVDRSEVIKIGVSAVEGDASSILRSMISPIPQGLGNESASGYHNISMPSGSKFVDDSFGQGSHNISSAEKQPQQQLPPIELMSLKPELIKAEGIRVGELLTENSSRAPGASSLSMVGMALPQKQLHQPVMQDIQAVEIESDYENDIIKTEEDEHEPEPLPCIEVKRPTQISPQEISDEDDYEF